MADLTDSERNFAAGDFNGDEERPRLESFSFDDVNEFAHHEDITFDELKGALLDIAAAWDRSRQAQDALLNREVQGFDPQ